LTASSNVAVGEILKFIDKLKFKKDESWYKFKPRIDFIISC
jgi:hypothetical protein